MNLSVELRQHAYAILNTVARNAETRAQLARIETTVLLGDLLATTNRRLGQTRRQACARIRRHQERYAPAPPEPSWLERHVTWIAEIDLVDVLMQQQQMREMLRRG